VYLKHFILYLHVYRIMLLINFLLWDVFSLSIVLQSFNLYYFFPVELH